jgi:hypothetical protein
MGCLYFDVLLFGIFLYFFVMLYNLPPFLSRSRRFISLSNLTCTCPEHFGLKYCRKPLLGNSVWGVLVVPISEVVYKSTVIACGDCGDCGS